MPYREPVTQRVVYWLGESGSGFKPRCLHGVQEIEKIKATCAKQGRVMFEDDVFPANDASIGTEDAGNYVWRRPHDIVPKGTAPEFIVGEADRFDIRQGDIGNCWLLAAVADLTLNEAFLQFTLTKDNSFTKKYCGAFHFRFWQYGKWIDVVVDDRLPCKRATGQLAFMHSEDSNEFWGPLLEKAFAKLNGSYKAIEGGFTFQGLQDFTGGFTEIFILSIPELTKMKVANDEHQVFELMLHAKKRCSFMGSSVKALKTKKEKRMANGLVQGHAYSITDVRRIPIKDGSGRCIELVRLRNPWGNAVEWNGDFSDNSPCWDEYFDPQVRSELSVTYRADGEFWMTVTDYLEQFERIEICHVFNSEVQDGAEVARFGDYIVHCKGGQWLEGSTTGGPFLINNDVNPQYETNPQYLLNINGTAEEMVLISLMKNERKAEGQCCIKRFSFDVFDITKFDPKTLPTPLDSGFFGDQDPLEKFNPPGGPREVTVRFMLNPGKYVIIPSTDKPNCVGDFLLRVTTKGESEFGIFDKSLHYAGDRIEIQESTPEKQQEMKKYQAFFADVAGGDDQVDWWELKLLLDKTFHAEFQLEAFGFSEDECRSLVALYDGDCSGRLDFFEFMKLWLNIGKWKQVFDKYAESQADGSPSVKISKLGEAFANAGYSVSKEVLSRVILRYGDRKGHLWLGKFISAAVRLESQFYHFKKMDIDGRRETLITFETWLTKTMYS